MNRDRDVIREPTDEDYKWATQGVNKDRDIVEALGGCWHEFNIGIAQYQYCIRCKISIYDFIAAPDFTSDAGKVQLLREMKEREDWSKFLSHIYCSSYRANECSIEWACCLILDTTGKLRDFAWEWLCGGEK